MDRVKVIIGEKEYNCQLAKTDEDRKKGLMGVKSLPADEGMLFEWKEEGRREMWMKDTSIQLDQIGINEDGEVTQVFRAIPESEDLVPFANVKWILEVNSDSGIKVGDDFEIDDDEDLNKYKMKVLAPDGTTQMLLQGGERIFSRISTLQMLKWVKKAEKVKDNSEEYDKICRRLGKRMFKEIRKQDNQAPQYVEGPEDKEQNNKEESKE